MLQIFTTSVEQTPFTTTHLSLSMLRANNRINSVANNLKLKTKNFVNKYCIRGFINHS